TPTCIACRNWISNFYRQCKLGWGPNTEAGGKSAYNNVQVGGAPTQKLTESQLTIMCKLAGPQHRS
ncbi:hypothetical protein APW93_00825, partial [Staphylococcus aureus]